MKKLLIDQYTPVGDVVRSLLTIGNALFSPIFTELSFNVSFLENPTEYPHKPYIARN